MQTTSAPDLQALVRPSRPIYEDPKPSDSDFPGWAHQLALRLQEVAEPWSDERTLEEIARASLQELISLVEEWADLPGEGYLAVERANGSVTG